MVNDHGVAEVGHRNEPVAVRAGRPEAFPVEGPAGSGEPLPAGELVAGAGEDPLREPADERGDRVRAGRTAPGSPSAPAGRRRRSAWPSAASPWARRSTCGRSRPTRRPSRRHPSNSRWPFRVPDRKAGSVEPAGTPCGRTTRAGFTRPTAANTTATRPAQDGRCRCPAMTANAVRAAGPGRGQAGPSARTAVPRTRAPSVMVESRRRGAELWHTNVRTTNVEPRPASRGHLL